MKKTIRILIPFILIISLCSCGTSTYEKHLSNVEEYVIEIRTQDTELTKEIKEDGLSVREDILQKTSARAMMHISDEYTIIESEEDKQNFLNNIKSRIPQNMYDKFSVQIEDGDLCEDFIKAYSTED